MSTPRSPRLRSEGNACAGRLSGVLWGQSWETTVGLLLQHKPFWILIHLKFKTVNSVIWIFLLCKHKMLGFDCISFFGSKAERALVDVGGLSVVFSPGHVLDWFTKLWVWGGGVAAVFKLVSFRHTHGCKLLRACRKEEILSGIIVPVNPSFILSLMLTRLISNPKM